ncbi:MAG: EAL domain-containing protein [Bryobacteraceae bacterium]
MLETLNRLNAAIAHGDEDVRSLIEILLTAGKRLEELTSGQVDAVIDVDGGPFVLGRAQKQLRFIEAVKQGAILNAIPAHIALIDVHGVIISVNEAWRRHAHGNGMQSAAHGVGLNYVEVTASANGEGSSGALQISSGIRAVLDGKENGFSLEYPCPSPTAQHWFLMTVTPLAPGHPGGAVVMHLDITERKQARSDLDHWANHDFLTGLPNRMLLHDRIDQAIHAAPSHKMQVAVLFLDLDGFKHINDSLGHPIGDKLLQSVAKRIEGCVGDSDTVSRQGGDEFVVLLPQADHWESAARIAGRILHSMAEAHNIDEHELHVTTSIGVSVYPEDGTDAETLIKNADTAMYQAKEKGRRSVQFFKSAMNVRAVERQFIEEGLRRAPERREFVLHYQPKIDLNTGTITGAEALIRWMHPTRGLISPAQFIPIAEECGLILPLVDWVLYEACRQVKAWVDTGLPEITVSVNVSAMQLRHENFLKDVFAILEETGLNPKSLELELTESVLMRDAEAAASSLQTLRGRGIRVGLDDFGSGYSSLSYLARFPIDTLKIDQSFVRGLSKSGADATIVTAIISMARILQLRVIAEGVETAEELAFLRAHHCDEVQGFYFSKPVSADQFAILLEDGLQPAPLLLAPAA